MKKNTYSLDSLKPMEEDLQIGLDWDTELEEQCWSILIAMLHHTTVELDNGLLLE
jgi:hypothetical protein